MLPFLLPSLLALALLGRDFDFLLASYAFFRRAAAAARSASLLSCSSFSLSRLAFSRASRLSACLGEGGMKRW